MFFYKTGNMPYPFPPYSVATVLHGDDSIAQLFYHETKVAEIKKDTFPFYLIILDTGGWSTRTTKRRINDFFSFYNLPLHLYQKDYRWYLSGSFPGIDIDIKFYNGISIYYNSLSRDCHIKRKDIYAIR